MNRPPAFQFYPRDWLDFRVQRMSYESQGIYLKLLCFMWADSKDQCSLPNDDKALSSALGISLQKWKSIKKELWFNGDPIFVEKNGKIFSKRLRKEALKQKDYREGQAEKGRKSGHARNLRRKQRLNNGSTVAPTGDEPKGNSSSSSSSSNKNEESLRKDSCSEPEKTASKPSPKINYNFESFEWENISEKDIELWKEAYPACDIEIELKKMASWLDSHPTKRKKNYKAFINNWLSRQQDSGGTKGGTVLSTDLDEEWIKSREGG